MRRVLALCALCVIGCGAESEPVGGAESTAGATAPVGRWHRVDDGAELSDEQREAFAELETIGYAGGTELAPESRSVTVHDERRSHPGLNFYTSGHGTEAVLIDMAGNELYRWGAAYREL